MIYTRRGSLKKEFGRRDFDSVCKIDQKRNSTGSALATVKYAHKISHENNRKISHNKRSGSIDEPKPIFGVFIIK